MIPTQDEFADARRQMMRALAVLTLPAMQENTLHARNLMFRTEELMKAMDDYFADREPPSLRLVSDD